MEIDQLRAACEWASTKFLIISENVFDPLIYYSHLIPLLPALILGIYVLSKGRKVLLNKIFAFITITFAFWSFFDLIVWATEKNHFTMFFWSTVNLLEVLIYAGCLYFIQVYIDGKDTSLKSKIIAGILLLPTIVLAATNFNLLGFDLSNCNRDAVEGPLSQFNYLIEIIFVIWIAIFAMNRLYVNKDKVKRTQIILVALGILLFLLTFSWGNIVGSLSDDWRLPQWGLLGMPVFIAFLTYLIVKFKFFNLKVIGAQALVLILWLLTVGILFLKTIETVRIITSITLVILLILGIQLVRSVKREVEQREKIQKLASDLEIANEGQATLIHFINHQIKGYLSKARIIFSELLTEPSYGPVTEPAKKMLETGQSGVKEGVDFVQQILKASDIEKGTIAYDIKSIDFKKLVIEVAAEMKPQALDKRLEFKFNIEGENFNIQADQNQLREAVKNLIDNSIKYTPSGKVEILLENKTDKVVLSVKDTGIGFDDALRAKLFTKGGRGEDSLKINVTSTGYGLAIVKGIIEAHKGKVWAESVGIGKGSTFFIELPI
ncbi:MAG TPA: ATP-binding protein [Candidatus Paceibacterota bacterium]